MKKPTKNAKNSNRNSFPSDKDIKLSANDLSFLDDEFDYDVPEAYVSPFDVATA